jgi:demethylmenaquinone methyltransferase/2-methoxy-6-polyprenyl-1,4-benzoquinol methylase
MDVTGPAPPEQLPRGDEKRRRVEFMFDRVAPRYDRVNRIMTFGLDRRWRRRAVHALALPPGGRVLDLGCGTGDLCEELRAAGHAAIGIDVSAGMLAAAHTHAPLVRADALRVPVPSRSFDGVVSGFALRNVVDLAVLFSESARVLRSGGRVAMLETDAPAARLLRAGHRLWFGGIVPAIGARFGSDREAYRYLPRSAAYLPPAAALLGLLRAAGFTDVRRRSLGAGAVQLVTGTRE